MLKADVEGADKSSLPGICGRVRVLCPVAQGAGTARVELAQCERKIRPYSQSGGVGVGGVFAGAGDRGVDDGIQGEVGASRLGEGGSALEAWRRF